MDEPEWQKCGLPLWPFRRTVEGKWLNSGGQVWRRRVNNRWEYKQDDETIEERLDSQW